MKTKLLASMIALSLLVMSTVGCASPAPQAAPGSGDAAQTDSAGVAPAPAKDAKPIVIYTADAGTPAFDAVLADIKSVTGIDAVGLAAPSNYPDLVPKITAMLSSNSDAVDIVALDELLGVSFSSAGYLEPVDDVMTPEVKKNFSADTMDKICSTNGVTYMLPTDAQPMFLFVNKQMFADAGLAYPTTGEEFVDAAKKLTSGDVYGYGAAWSLGGQLYNDAVRWMYAYDGDYLDWTNPNSKEAMQAMYNFINVSKITPAAVIGDTYDIANQKFIDGKYAMLYQWPYLYSVIGEETFSDKYEIIPVPTFKTNKSINAGWNFAINAASANKEAAKEVLKYFASNHGQNQLITLRNASCASAEVLTSPEIVAKYPMLGEIGEYSAAGSLMPRPINDKINALMDATESTLQNYLTGKITLDECVAKGQADIDAIMAQ